LAGWPDVQPEASTAQEILIREAPALYIFDQDQTFVYNTRIHNFSTNPAYTEVVFFYTMWKDTS
jgi:peptide/nickel transport system substrate-binding protein